MERVTETLHATEAQGTDQHRRLEIRHAMTGSLKLRDHPRDVVRLSCEKWLRWSVPAEKSNRGIWPRISRYPACATRSRDVNGEERSAMHAACTISS